MSLIESIKNREASLTASLRELQQGIVDPNGKGSATEQLVESVLIRPYLPPAFDCGKGAVVEGHAPDDQSEALDRVVYYKEHGSPLLFNREHSIFPIECVAGVVEITMRLSARKLRNDVKHTARVHAMRTRMMETPIHGEALKSVRGKVKGVGPRAYLVGYLGNPKWAVKKIGEEFLAAQVANKTLVHGLYVVGVAYFQTHPEAGPNKTSRVQVFAGDDRLFRFVTAFRNAFDRWIPDRPYALVDHYLPNPSGQWLDLMP